MIDQNIVEYYNTQRKCYICQSWFIEKENIGQLECRIHPGVVLYGDKNRRYYSCCGSIFDVDELVYKNKNSSMPIVNKNALGCLAIDHFDYDALESKGIIDIKEEKLSFLIKDKWWFSDKPTKIIKEIQSLSIFTIPLLLYNNRIVKYPINNTVLETFNEKNIEIIINTLNDKSTFNNSIQTYIKKYDLSVYNNCLNSVLIQNKNFKHGIKNDYGSTIDISLIEKNNTIELNIWDIINELSQKYKEPNKLNTNLEIVSNIWNDDYNKIPIEESNKLSIVPFLLVRRIGTTLEYTTHGYKM